VQEGDALIAMIDPEHCRADALGEQQARRAADERAEHVRHRGIAQLPLEGDRQHREGHAERGVHRVVVAERLKLVRRIRYCANE
jgi:hypothetical protein